MLKKFIAPASFYKKAADIAIPLAIQFMLAACMSIVDTMMVSRIGMVSAVGTAAQIDSMSMLMALGGTSGSAIFLAQFVGAKDEKNIKRTFGLSIILAIICSALFVVLCSFFSTSMIKFYMDDAHVIEYGNQYLSILKYGFIGSALTMSFAYAYRTVNKAKLTLRIGIIAMITNVSLNYLLIFGNFGFPELGVKGAALATVIGHWTSVAIYVLYSVKTKPVFIGSIKQMFLSLEKSFVVTILRKIWPLIFNELLFGFGGTLFIKAFGSLGTESMDAYYVGSKISEIFFFVIMGLSNAAVIMLGKSLGKGEIEKAKKESVYFLAISATLAVIMAAIILLFAKPLVMLFGLTDINVFNSAVGIVRVFSIRISLRLFIVIAFAALRAGGDSKFLTFLDCGIVWLVGLPAVFIVVHVIGITNIEIAFLFIQIEHVIRAIIGLWRLKSAKWAVDLTKSIKS